MVDGSSTFHGRRVRGLACVEVPGEAAPPRLLVSVRNVDEAASALDGGADIIDVKEPSRGSLGMAHADTIAAVIDAVAGRVPVSAALGEVSDWRSGVTGSAGAIPVLPAGLTFAKLGLASTCARADWSSDLLGGRRAFEAAAGLSLPWVAVGYADLELAGAPPVEKVIAAASQTGCLGILIDTFDKSSGSLLRLRASAELAAWRTQARERGLLFAIAGKLQAGDLRNLAIRGADVVGVRSAACAGGDRQDQIAAGRVAALKRTLCAARPDSPATLTAARS